MKKMLTLALCLLLLCGLLALPVLADHTGVFDPFDDPSDDPLDDPIRGDINRDGLVDTLDYLTLKRYILETLNNELDEAQLWAADFNGDGDIETVDYIALKKNILADE